MSDWQLQMPGGALSGGSSLPASLNLAGDLQPPSAASVPPLNPSDPTTLPIIPPLQPPAYMAPAASGESTLDPNGGGPSEATPGGTGPSALTEPPAAPAAAAAATTPAALPAAAAPSDQFHTIDDWKEALTLLGISFEDISDDEKLKAFLTSKGLSMSEIEDGISWEEAQKLAPTVTRAYYDILSTGGRRTEGDGKVEMADIQRFNEKVIERLSQGTGQRAVVLERYLHKAHFVMVPIQEAILRLPKNVKDLLTTSTSTGIQATVCEVLSHILGQTITMANIASIDPTLTLSDAQADVLHDTMLFLAKIDNPSIFYPSAANLPRLEGDTSQHYLAYFTKGTSHEVAAPPASTASTETAQDGQNPQNDLPAELKEGMKNIFVYENDKFTTGGANNDQYVPRANVSIPEYNAAIAHFKSVIANTSLSLQFRKRAYAYLIQCYESLAKRSQTYAEVTSNVQAIMDVLNTPGAVEAFGAATATGQMFAMAELAMDENLMYVDAPSSHVTRRLEAEQFIRDHILNVIEPKLSIASGLEAGEVTQLKAQLAQTLAGMYSLPARQHALEIARSMTGSIQVPSHGPDGQIQRGQDGQVVTTTMPAEEFLKQVQQMASQHPAITEGLRMIFTVGTDQAGHPTQQLTGDAAKLQKAIEIFQLVMADLQNSTEADRARSGYWMAICKMSLAQIAWSNGNHDASIIALFKEAADLFNQAAGSFKTLAEAIADPYSSERGEFNGLREAALAQIISLASTLIQTNVGGSRQAGKEIAQLLDRSDNVTQIHLNANLTLTPKKAREELLGSHAINVQTAVTQQGMAILTGATPPASQDGNRHHHTTGGGAGGAGGVGGAGGGGGGGEGEWTS